MQEHISLHCEESENMATSQIAQSSSSLKKPVIGALLVHGLNGSRRDMEELEAFLNTGGVLAHNMLLPGHGTHVREMLLHGWTEWADAVTAELNMLKQRCDVVFLVGHSLGGALVLHVAAHEEVAGIVTMCAPIYMPYWMKPIVGTMKYVVPFLPKVREDVRDPVARRLYRKGAPDWYPMQPVASMLQFLPQLRAELPRVTAPALIMASMRDHVVPARNGREIYRLIGSREKHLVTFHHSYHIIMKDYDAEEVFTKTSAFIMRHAVQAKTHRDSSSAGQTA